MKALVIAEKPSVARDIARVLKCGKKINGAIEGERYIVTWGLGHLVTLADPEDYDKKYKEWKIDVLPMKPAPFKLEVIKQTGKQFAAVKTQIHRKDVNEIIIATDAGREGELVARLILEKAGSKKPIKRLWISSVTDKAIREGFAKLKNGHEYDALYDAAMCRAEADWLVGINATRALTCKYNAQLSCGRVQTPTLAMIAKREEKIRSFIPEGYYGMTAKGQNIMLTWQDQKSKSYRSFDKEKMTGLMKKLDEQKAVVEEIKKTPKKTYAPLLYDLTELQREANQRFGYSAKETLNIMQRLYENHKVLTYPRTDSRYLSKDIVPTIKDRLEACGTGPYRKLAMTAKKKDLSGKLAFVNDAKVSDHHAIIPTEQFVDLSHMTNEERKIYDLVVRRFLAVLYPPFEYEKTQVTVKVGGETFLASGKVVKAQGWRAVYEEEIYSAEDEEEEEAYESGKGLKGQTLPELEKGQEIKGLVLSLTEGKTKPPAHFNEDTLLSAMESAGKEDTPEDAERKGLGTTATRAGIIEKLISAGFAERKGKKLIPTKDGYNLVAILPDSLTSPQLTAEWETRLTGIAKGSDSPADFMRGIEEMTAGLVKTYSAISEDKAKLFTPQREAIGTCPRCGAAVYEGKKNFYCSDRACSFVMWKNDRFFEQRKKAFTKAIAAALLKDGKVKIKGMYSTKTGKTFDGVVLLADTGGKYVNFRVEQNRK